MIFWLFPSAENFKKLTKNMICVSFSNSQNNASKIKHFLDQTRH